MKLGDLVVILGKMDNRVRDQSSNTLIIGTLEQLLNEGQVSVILEDGNIWVGHKRDIALASEQE